MRLAIEAKGWCVGMKGDWQKALEFFKEVHRLANHPLKGIAPMGYAYGKLGEKQKAMEIIGRLEQRQKEEPDTAMDGDLLMVWWSLGDKEKTFQYVSSCINKDLNTYLLLFRIPYDGRDKRRSKDHRIASKNYFNKNSTGLKTVFIPDDNFLVSPLSAR
jgi:hypothetical protein